MTQIIKSVDINLLKLTNNIVLEQSKIIDLLYSNIEYEKLLTIKLKNKIIELENRNIEDEKLLTIKLKNKIIELEENINQRIGYSVYDNSIIEYKKKQINCSSKYIGVHKSDKKWIAEIVVDSEKKYVGSFDREQDAALARDYATRKFFGDSGNLNFPKIPNWDTYFMNVAEVVKTRSPDYCKVGSVLVSIKNKRIISTGYNSIASGLNDDIDWSNRNIINNIVIHAEMNVLLYSNSNFEDSILYTTLSPCSNCLKMLSAAKIKKIIYKNKYKDIENVQKLAIFFNIELIEYVEPH